MRKFRCATFSKKDLKHILSSVLVAAVIAAINIFYFSDSGLSTQTSVAAYKAAEKGPEILKWIKELYEWLTGLY